jgi:hypothetical protein
MSAPVKLKIYDDPMPHLFDPESLGQSFEEFAIDIVQGESTEFISRWFRADSGEADLVIWIDSAKRIVKQQICIYGQVVEWNPINGTRTGVIVELENEMQADEVSETIQFDTRVQNAAVENAIRVLQVIPDLTEADRRSLIFHMRESPKLHKKARERALKTWAPRAEEIISDQRSSVWTHVRKWFLGL